MGQRPLVATPLGAPGSWARDFAILGLISALAIPLAAVAFVARGAYLGMAMSEMATYFVAAPALGLATGLAFGPALRAALLRCPSAPFGLLLIAVPLFAAGWGALVAWGAVPLSLPGATFSDTSFAAALGALSAGIQLAWFWPLYLGRRVRDRSAVPLLAAAALTSLVIGPLAVWSIS